MSANPVNLINSSAPGVYVHDEAYGAIPLARKAFRTIYLVGAALRGPTNKYVPVTSLKNYHEIFGARTPISFLHHAVRGIEDNGQVQMYILRAIADNAAKASLTLKKAGTKQVTTATVAGTISGSGNVAVTVTAAGMTGSPKTLNVAVLNGDSASVVAGKIRTALAADSDVSARFAVSGSGTSVVLTRLVAAANDATLNIALATGSATGLTAAPTSAPTTPGVADVNVLKIEAVGEGADYNYTAGPPAKGISARYIDGILEIYDGSTLIGKYSNTVYTQFASSQNVVNGRSKVIAIQWLNTTTNPDNYETQTGLSGGDDGDDLVDADYIATIQLLKNKYLTDGVRKPLGWYICPGITSQSVNEELITAAEVSRGYAQLQSTLGNSVSQTKTERSLFASAQGYAGYDYGWDQTTDLDTNAPVLVPHTPIDAALWARSHTNRGSIANVGAGTNFKLRGITGLEVNVDELTQSDLNEFGINVARNLRGEGYGLVQWGARTISPDVLYRFRHVRIILNVIAETIEIGLLPYVFRPYDGRGELAAEIKGSINSLLYTFWNADVLFGGLPKDAFLVKIDPDFTELEQGVVGISVFVKPTPIAERINVTIYRVPISFDLKTGQVTQGDPERAAA